MLLTGLLLAAWLDGYFSAGVDWSFRRYAFFAVAVAYMLVMLPVVKRLAEQAVESADPLRSGHEPLRKELSVDHRRETIVLLVGFVTAFPAMQLWLGGEPARIWTQWTTWYFVATGLASNLLFPWMVYLAILRGLHIAHLCKHELQIDLFQAEQLAPFARLSQFSAIGLIGFIALSLPLQTLELLRATPTIVSYSVLLTGAVLSFFITLRPIHRALVLSQTGKLAVIRTNLLQVRTELDVYASQSSTVDNTQLHARYAAWSFYELQVKDASTWPFDHKMVKQVLGSTLVPLSVYLLKLTGGMLERQHLF